MKKVRGFEHMGTLDRPNIPYLEQLINSGLVSKEVRENFKDLLGYIAILERLEYVKTEKREIEFEAENIEGELVMVSETKHFQIYKDEVGGVWSYEREI